MILSRPSSTAVGLALVAALVLPGLSGCGPGQGPAKAAKGVATDATLLLAPEDLLELRATPQAQGPVISGTLQPARRADLRAEVGAVVVQILKDNGQRVRRGELLLRLDATSLRDALESATASVRSAANGLEQATRSLERLQTLRKQGMTTTQAVEDAEQRRNNAQSDLVAARAREVSARQQVQRTTVQAPFDGVVSERRVSIGDTVGVGRELLKVIDPGSMRLEGLVSADRMRELKLGQKVDFRVNGYPQQRFAGRVARIDPTASADTRQAALVVEFDDPKSAPRVAGLFAEGVIETGSAEVLLLSEASLTRSAGGVFAWRLDGDKLAKVALQLGERDPRSGDFPVTQGLKAGDRILRRPGDALVEGQKVEFAAPGALAASAATLR